MNQRRAITFIEIMAALALFSAVVATALISMRAARDSLENAALERQARQVLQTWRISQATDDPLPEEFEDEQGWIWRVIDEATESEYSFTDDQIEAARATTDMDEALRLLGVDPETLGRRAAGDPTEEETTPRGPLLELRWSSIRVELLRPERFEDEPVVVLRRRYVRDMTTNSAVAAALAAGSRQAQASGGRDPASLRASQAGTTSHILRGEITRDPQDSPARPAAAPARRRDASPTPEGRPRQITPSGPVDRQQRGPNGES